MGRPALDILGTLLMDLSLFTYFKPYFKPISLTLLKEISLQPRPYTVNHWPLMG